MATTTATFAGCSSRAGHCFRRVPVIGSCVPRATSRRGHSRRPCCPHEAAGRRRAASGGEGLRRRPSARVLPCRLRGQVPLQPPGGAGGGAVLEK